MAEPMPLDEAVRVLRGTTPYPIVDDDMDRATAAVLAELDARAGDTAPDDDASADEAVRRLRALTERHEMCREDVDTVIAVFDRLRARVAELEGERDRLARDNAIMRDAEYRASDRERRRADEWQQRANELRATGNALAAIVGQVATGPGIAMDAVAAWRSVAGGERRG